MPHQAEIRINLVGKKQREAQSHALALRLHDPLTKIAEKHKARIKIVELPPGPPVLSSDRGRDLRTVSIIPIPS